MSTRQWNDSFGNDQNSSEGPEEEGMWGGPDDDDFVSDEEWLNEAMDDVRDELEDLADLRPTGHMMLEGEIDANLWLTLEFQTTDLPGPSGTEGLISVTVEGSGEAVTGQAEVPVGEPMSFVREEVRAQVEETLELHPASE